MASKNAFNKARDKLRMEHMMDEGKGSRIESMMRGMEIQRRFRKKGNKPLSKGRSKGKHTDMSEI